MDEERAEPEERASALKAKKSDKIKRVQEYGCGLFFPTKQFLRARNTNNNNYEEHSCISTYYEN